MSNINDLVNKMGEDVKVLLKLINKLSKIEDKTVIYNFITDLIEHIDISNKSERIYTYFNSFHNNTIKTVIYLGNL